MKTSALPPLPAADTIRHHVRERYGAIAEQADDHCGCQSSGCCCGGASQPQNYGEKLGYTPAEIAAAADGDLGLGCGNPLAIAGIKPGETVLDLGSGAGFDCLLAARQLAGTGKVIGVDMTPAMIEKARANAAKNGFANLEFRLGEIEEETDLRLLRGAEVRDDDGTHDQAVSAGGQVRFLAQRIAE